MLSAFVRVDLRERFDALVDELEKLTAKKTWTDGELLSIAFAARALVALLRGRS